MIEILTTGLVNTVQDQGRSGHLALGVTRAGAMDALSLAAGNALLGNPADAAGIEVAFFPFRLRFGQETAFAVTGAACDAVLDGWALPPDWAVSAKAGQVLALGPPRRGTRAYVALGGGVNVPPVLGSRATELKSTLGGLQGRGLRRGDRLALLPCEMARPPGAGFGAVPLRALPGAGAEVALRVLLAAEHEAFDAPSQGRFAAGSWAVTAEANRMGFRLDGPPLFRTDPVELFSHGVVPGVVQVPPGGQPIIQMSDANTCGGYPKIATVVAADLPLLAQSPIGTRLRFVVAAWEAQRAALAEQAAWLADVRATAALLRGS